LFASACLVNSAYAEALRLQEINTNVHTGITRMSFNATGRGNAVDHPRTPAYLLGLCPFTFRSRFTKALDMVVRLPWTSASSRFRIPNPGKKNDQPAATCSWGSAAQLRLPVLGTRTRQRISILYVRPPRGFLASSKRPQLSRTCPGSRRGLPRISGTRLAAARRNPNDGPSLRSPAEFEAGTGTDLRALPPSYAVKGYPTLQIGSSGGV